jgi:hypothetical protein
MAYNTTLGSAQVMNNAIRDTNPALSGSFLLDQMNKTVALIQNNTDQDVVISTKWSSDNSSYANVGSSVTVVAGATLVTNETDTTLTGIKLMAGYLKVVATAAVAPLSGSVIVTLQGMNN